MVEGNALDWCVLLLVIIIAAREYSRTHLLPERVLCYYYRALEAYAARQKGTPTVAQDMVYAGAPQRPKVNTCNMVDPFSQLKDYPIVPLHPSISEKTLNTAGPVSSRWSLRRCCRVPTDRLAHSPELDDNRGCCASLLLGPLAC